VAQATAFTVEQNVVNLCPTGPSLSRARWLSPWCWSPAKRACASTASPAPCARVTVWGPVWADRYHERILRSPREVRVYVLGNWRHHGGERYPLGCIDPCSSAPWFSGFQEPTLPPPVFSPPPVAPARTWLLAHGYRRYKGRLSVDEGAWSRRRVMPKIVLRQTSFHRRPPLPNGGLQ
jgi:hypothetical protein